VNPLAIFPAIDLKDGRCVRLRQGRADDEQVYSDDPVATALRWEREGAAALHVVDLDGAFSGHPVNDEWIGRIAQAVGIPVQCGGGLRTDEDVRRLFDRGVRRVVLGTRALLDPEALRALAARHGDRLAAGIDARDGRVQVRGWTETTGVLAVDLARQAESLGVRTIIYTDTARDGMLAGVNAEAMRTVCGAVACAVIASGGVASTRDIAALRALGCPNLAGVIVGKALYEGRVTLGELRAAAAAEST
jgi:phosphoribosylformimino-5-aminoimidazole carboxamide ribotide isomerase